MTPPTGVLFGTVASSVGAEGAAPGSDWAGWEVAGRVPPSRDGNGFGSVAQATADLELLAANRIGAHRMVLEWARLEPSPGRRDPEEVRRYREILAAGRRAGLAMWVCLHHVSLPGWFSEDERGFLDDQMAGRVWPAHVDWVAETFGDLVDGWVPVHEPATYAALAWREGLVPPGRRDEDDWWTGLGRLRAAARQAANQLRGAGAPVVCAHPPGEPAEELRADAEVFDWIGLDHVAAEGRTLLGALHRLVDDIGSTSMPVAVTAIGVGTRDDDERAEKLTASLAAVAEGVGDGIEVRAVFHRTAVDGYEWHDGFEVPWGLFDRSRNPRPSLSAFPGPFAVTFAPDMA